MDSVTQIVLGASVGEAVLGKKAGNRAILWGGIMGMLPDLDIIPALLMDTIARIQLHRSFTHSILFSIIFSPIFGFLLYRLYRKRISASPQAWSLMVFFALVTHFLLDCFTSYGTMIFYPFSNYRVAFNSISIADPLYTLPLAICLFAIIFIKRNPDKRKMLNYIGLTVSTFYLFFTVVNKFVMEEKFKNELNKKNYSYLKIFSSPTFLNNFLWLGIAERKDCYLLGYSSWFDNGPEINFMRLEKNHHLINDIIENNDIKILIWFSRGYFIIEKYDKYIYFHDIRYGIIPVDMDNCKYIFSFGIEKGYDKLKITRLMEKFENTDSFSAFFKRVFGDEQSLSKSCHSTLNENLIKSGGR